MPSYGNQNFKESNVKYLNKDFASLKNSLMEYAKSYFPDSYRDFNETSPGMMLIEMNAYVGDVLSFYIDQQYKEMMLPLAEERRNIMNMAKMFGYKVKPIVPAYVDVTFSQNLDVMAGDTSKVDYSSGGIFQKGMRVTGGNNTAIFETLDVVDFQISQSALDTNNPSAVDSTTGLVSGYTLHRTVKAVSGRENISTFTIDAPEKFKKITLSETNVVDIISCVDSNGNNWYEVDFLAQDKVPVSTHYTEEGRTSAYQNLITQQTEDLPVPYSLEYIKTSKRFTRETNIDNTTSLVFGNGILKDGNLIDGDYIDLEQVGIVVPGQSNDLNSAIDPLLGDEYSTLGETPAHTTLTITYRIGGGVESNILANSLDTVSQGTVLSNNGVTITDLTPSNPTPAVGGKDDESIDEIRENTKAFFTTQNRCVTKEDYEARIMNLPSKYGNIAKVYVARDTEAIAGDTTNFTSYFNQLVSLFTSMKDDFSTYQNLLLQYNSEGWADNGSTHDITTGQTITSYNNYINSQGAVEGALDNLNNFNELPAIALSAINIYILAYDDNKNLVGNPMITWKNVSDNVPSTLLVNIKNYLNNFKLLTDTIAIYDGYIVNFGVFFDVVAEKYADKQQVKLKCIQKIKEYFKIEKMQFNQPIFKSQLEYELMGVEGVRSIGHITISQDTDYHSDAGVDDELPEPTFTYAWDANIDIDDNSDNGVSGAFDQSAAGSIGYGYLYNFENAEEGGIIRPPLTSTPTVFELKNSNQNIKGRVR
jgi:hypothetical protein